MPSPGSHRRERQRVPIASSQPEIVFEEEAPAAPARRRTHQVAAARKLAGEVMWPSTWTFTRTTFLTLVAAVMVATVFSYWTPDDVLPEEFNEQMRIARVTDRPLVVTGTPLPTEVTTPKIGIIAGHSGPPQDPSFAEDPGAVCDDNNDGNPELRELDINVAVSRMVADRLLLRGYEVEILQEFDPRLRNYRAAMLLSIHTNDCRNYGFGATGYNVVGPFSRGVADGINEILVSCLINEYGRVTALPRHFGVTVDMTSYHNFAEVSVDTPVAIIELGYMFADRQILTQNRDVLAEGLVAGILCFMEPPNILTPSPPAP
jgi:N-acetylmuramoyl-L-alanine amidase